MDTGVGVEVLVIGVGVATEMIVGVAVGVTKEEVVGTEVGVGVELVLVVCARAIIEDEIFWVIKFAPTSVPKPV